MLARRSIIATPVLILTVLALNFSAPTAARAETKKDISLLFGGATNPATEVIKDVESDVRVRRHFSFGGYFRYLWPMSEDLYVGARGSVHHLRNDVRLGGMVIGTLGQMPMMISAEALKYWGPYGVDLRMGAGGSVNSFGNGTLLNDYEEDNNVIINVGSENNVVYAAGVGFEYKLSTRSTAILDADYFLGDIKLFWPSALDLPIKGDMKGGTFSVMIGVAIALGDDT